MKKHLDLLQDLFASDPLKISALLLTSELILTREELESVVEQVSIHASPFTLVVYEKRGHYYLGFLLRVEGDEVSILTRPLSKRLMDASPTKRDLVLPIEKVYSKPRKPTPMEELTNLLMSSHTPSQAHAPFIEVTQETIDVLPQAFKFVDNFTRRMQQIIVVDWGRKTAQLAFLVDFYEGDVVFATRAFEDLLVDEHHRVTPSEAFYLQEAPVLPPSYKCPMMCWETPLPVEEEEEEEDEFTLFLKEHLPQSLKFDVEGVRARIDPHLRSARTMMGITFEAMKMLIRLIENPHTKGTEEWSTYELMNGILVEEFYQNLHPGGESVPVVHSHKKQKMLSWCVYTDHFEALVTKRPELRKEIAEFKNRVIYRSYASRLVKLSKYAKQIPDYVNDQAWEEVKEEVSGVFDTGFISKKEIAKRTYDIAAAWLRENDPKGGKYVYPKHPTDSLTVDNMKKSLERCHKKILKFRGRWMGEEEE